MRRLIRPIAMVAVLALARLAPAHAAALVDTVTLIGDATVSGNQVPAAQIFTVATAGSYTITVTDLGVATTQNPTPAVPQLQSLELAIATSSSTAVTLTVP